MTVTGRAGSSKAFLACVDARDVSPTDVLLDLTKQESAAIITPGFVRTGEVEVERIDGPVREVNATRDTAPVCALGSVFCGVEA